MVANKTAHFLFFILLIPIILVSTLLISGSLDVRARAEESRLIRLITQGAYDVVDAIGFEFLSIVSHLTTDMFSQIEENQLWTLELIDQTIENYKTFAQFPQLLKEVAFVVEFQGERKFIQQENDTWIQSDFRPSWFDPTQTSIFSLEYPVIPIPIPPNLSRLFSENLTPQLLLIRIDVPELIERVIPTYAQNLIHDGYSNSSYKVQIFHGETSTNETLLELDTFVPLLPWQELRSWIDIYRIRNENVLRPMQETSTRPQRRFSPGDPLNRWYLGIVRQPRTIQQHILIYRWTNYLFITLYFVILSGGTLALYASVLKSERNLDYERTITGLISHELKTPLSVLTTLTENIQGNYGSPDNLNKYAPLIYEQTQRLQAIVDKTISIGQIQSLDNVQVHEPVDIAVVLDTIVNEKKQLVEYESVRWNVMSTQNLWVNTSEIVIGMVLENLISNALLYGIPDTSTSEKPTITIGMNLQKRRFVSGILITIEDQGPGISKSERNNIFKPYYRGVQAQENSIEGTGLGLYLVSSTMKALGGSLHLSTRNKIGAKFELWFPGRKMV